MLQDVFGVDLGTKPETFFKERRPWIGIVNNIEGEGVATDRIELPTRAFSVPSWKLIVIARSLV
jgi:hypothetical protein